MFRAYKFVLQPTVAQTRRSGVAAGCSVRVVQRRPGGAAGGVALGAAAGDPFRAVRPAGRAAGGAPGGDGVRGVRGPGDAHPPRSGVHGVLPPAQGGAEARLPAVSVPVPVRFGVLAGPLRVGARHRAEALPGAGRRSHQGAPAPQDAGDREDGDAAPGGTPLGVRDLLRRGAGRPARPDRAGGGHRRWDRQPGGHQRRRVRRQPAPGPGVGGPGGATPSGPWPENGEAQRGGEKPSPGSPTCAGTRPTSAATSPTRCRAPSSTATT